MTITEFLTARYDEEEAAEWKRIDDEVANLRTDGLPDTTRDDLLTMRESDHWRRPLADIAAKRALIADLAMFDKVATEKASSDPATSLTARGIERGIMHALRTLAQPFAEHPDFDPEWRTT